MSYGIKKGLLATSAMVLAASQPVWAQESETVTPPDVEQEQADTLRHDVVIVTAQKRETSLQDTPLAISAFSGSSMERQGVDDISRLQSSVPTLHVGQEQSSYKVSIRGIGTYNTGSISDPGVAFYQDGFYIPRPSGGSAKFFDINRIEVLKGPQGTLYGRNATGGVVNIIANEPVFEAGGRIGVSYGDRNLMEARGLLNLPLTDNLAVRLTGVYNEQEGYVENHFPGGKDLHGTDGDTSVRGQLLYQGADDLELLLSVSHSDINGTGAALRFHERNLGGSPPVRAFLSMMPADFASPLDISTDADNYNDTTTTMAFGRLTKGFGGVELFVQAGQLKQETALNQDVDSSPLPISTFGLTQDNEASSVEVRLASTDTERLDWLVGAYYFEEDTSIVRSVDLNGFAGGNIIPLEGLLIQEYGEAETFAVFGSATYALTSVLSLTGGLRYTEDKRGGEQETPLNFGRPGPSAAGEVEFSEVTWKAGLEYRPQDDLLLFGSVSNGYKAGGFNLSTTGEPYDPELVTAYEAGLKSSPWNGLAIFNVDVYYYDYSDLQLTNLKLDPLTGNVNRLTANAAATTIWGSEVNGQVEVFDGVLLKGGYAYTDATFDEYFNQNARISPPVPNPSDPAGLDRIDLSGYRLPYIAKHNLTAGVSYAHDLGESKRLVFALNSSWHSDKYFREFEDPIDRQGPNSKTDASVTLDLEKQGLTLTGYINNIEDNTEKNNTQISPGFIGVSAIGSYTEPRTYGVRLDYKF